MFVFVCRQAVVWQGHDGDNLKTRQDRSFNGRRAINTGGRAKLDCDAELVSNILCCDRLCASAPSSAPSISSNGRFLEILRGEWTAFSLEGKFLAGVMVWFSFNGLPIGAALPMSFATALCFLGVFPALFVTSPSTRLEEG